MILCVPLVPVLTSLKLAYEARKAKKIIASRDISYAFTNIMANHYYSLREFDNLDASLAGSLSPV